MRVAGDALPRAGILEIVYCALKGVLQLLNTRILAAERRLMPSPAIFSAAETMSRRIVPWEIARTVPFAVASVVLLFIARRLRAGDLGALAVARQWAIAALGVVGVSLIVQFVAVVPATLDYQTKLADSLPSASRTGAPFDVGAMMSSLTMMGMVTSVGMGALILSAWPIVLYVWAGRLQRDARGAS